MGHNFKHNFVSFFAKINGFDYNFTRVRNFLLSYKYCVFNSTLTYILCAITIILLLYSNNLIFSASDAAVYFLFNNPLVGILATDSGNDIAFGG